MCVRIAYIPDSPVSRPHRSPPVLWSRVYRYRGYIRVSVPNLPECRVPVLEKYRTYRSVGYRYRNNTELTEVSGTGIEKVPNLPKCSVGYRARYRTNTGTPGIAVEGIPVPGVYLGQRTELTEVSGTGIGKIPNLPKCRVPVFK